MASCLNSLSSDSGSEDFCEEDGILLENAEQLMSNISPEKVFKTSNTKDQTPLSKKLKLDGQKTLSKHQLQSVSEHLKDHVNDILTKATLLIQNEKFWDALDNGRQFLESIQVLDGYRTVLEAIFDDYIQIYVHSFKGLKSAKYMDFQISWFKNGQKYMCPDDQNIESLMTQIFKQTPIQMKSNVISAMHCGIAKACSAEIISYMDKSNEKGNNEKCQEGTRNENLADQDFMLYKLHGWVVYELKNHVNSGTCSMTDTDINSWSDILLSITVSGENKNLPCELQYFERSTNKEKRYIYPNPAFITFMRQSDMLFKDYASEENFVAFGKDIYKVLKCQLKSNKFLRSSFNEGLLLAGITECDNHMLDKLYELWLEKYCNVRIKDRLAAIDLLSVSNDSKITSKTQNLRDQLLSDHVKAKGHNV